MAQRKHNNLQILQAKNKTKLSLKALYYILIGFISGIVCSIIAFSVYLSFNSNARHTLASKQEHKLVDQLATQPPQTETEKVMITVEDTELSGLFKPRVTQANDQDLGTTPFSKLSGEKVATPPKKPQTIEKTKAALAEKTAKTKQQLRHPAETPTEQTPQSQPEDIPEKKQEISNKTPENIALIQDKTMQYVLQFIG